MIVLLSACAAEVRLAPVAAQASAKRFRWPPRNRANIYVYRHESFDPSANVDSYVDGTRVATMGPGTFAVLPVCPGLHTLTTKAPADSPAERRIRDQLENDGDLPLRAQAGWNYFVRLQVAWQAASLAPRPTSFAEVERTDGKREVMACEMIEESYLLETPKCPVDNGDGA